MSEVIPAPGKEEMSPHAAAFLTTEHWSLLATRSMIWNEAFSRVTLFLTVLSASIVALALVANTAGLGDTFEWFGIALAPLVLFLGVTTYLRLVEINLEEFLYVSAMNRLRHAYVEMAPEVKRYLTTGWHDDARGIFKTFVLARSSVTRPLAHFFVTTPTVVAVVDAAVASVTGALVANKANAEAAVTTTIALVTFLVVGIGLFLLQFRSAREFKRLTPRFPSTGEDYRDEIGRVPF
jgi:hypothetical protein